MRPLGRDLACAGTALPLVILFCLLTQPWYLTFNRELPAGEIVRTRAGSLGLLAAGPRPGFIVAQAIAAVQPPAA